MKIELAEWDRICFLGDSITADGRWIAEIFDYFAKNYPEKEIEFYNCGIAGSCGCDADLKNRLFVDCFRHFPKYVVIMFGMNDIGRSLYAPDCQEPDKESLKKERIEKLFAGILDAIEKCKAVGATPILCSTTPYDEYNDYEEPNLCCDSGLLAVADRLSVLAKKQNLLYIDMHSPLMKFMDKKPIGPDRVHPNDFGHHLIAEHFLYEIGAKLCEEPDTTAEWSETNRARFDAEQKIRNIYFLERAYLGWQHAPSVSIKERILLLDKKVQEVADTPGMGWVADCAGRYAEDISYMDEIRGEILRLTKAMYK